MSGTIARVDELLRGGPWATQSERPWLALGGLLIVIGLFGMFYGAIMGSFGLTGAVYDGRAGELAGELGRRVLAQISYSALKVPLLLLATFLISLPSFFVLGTLMGLRPDLAESLRALTATQAGLAVILASLAPFTCLWYASSADYEAAVMFNGLMFGAASFGAQWLLRRYYGPLIARDRRHRWLMSGWIVVYAFVGIQMAWVLRPFVGDPRLPAEFLRPDQWDNAYIIVAKTLWKVLGF